ncbi:MAG: hypothetical protein PXY39_13445 [archaeon]|nr:hypothetical protein [archaeon]
MPAVRLNSSPKARPTSSSKSVKEDDPVELLIVVFATAAEEDLESIWDIGVAFPETNARLDSPCLGIAKAVKTKASERILFQRIHFRFP